MVALSLQKDQSVFARKIVVLMQVAFEMAYEITCGDFYRAPPLSYGHVIRALNAINLDL